jgi:hypothetical protein
VIDYDAWILHLTLGKKLGACRPGTSSSRAGRSARLRWPSVMYPRTVYTDLISLRLLARFGEVESMGTSTRQWRNFPPVTARFSRPSCGPESVVRPSTHPVSPNLAKSPVYIAKGLRRLVC